MKDFFKKKINGFSVGVVELPYLESVTVGILIPVGSRNEAGYPAGIAHFLEHMIFKGTSSLNCHELAKKVEGAGCSSDAYTSEDQTVLELVGPYDQLEVILKTCADMLWDSTFLPQDIESESSVIEEEIQGYLETPSEHIFELASQSLWGDSPLGLPITGTVESIKKITQDDLFSFQNKYYKTPGIVIAVAGNIKHQEVYDLISKYYPTLSDKNQAELSTQNAITSENLVTTKTEYIKHYSEIEQCHLCINFPTFSTFSPKKSALQIMSIILGETMSSRLFQQIREKHGLCYSIDSDYTLFDDTGIFQVYAALDHNRFNEAEEKIHQVIQSMHLSPPSEEEFLAAQRFAIAQHRISLEGSGAHMEWVGASLLKSDTIKQPSEGIDKLKAITLDDVIQVAKEILDETKMAKAAILPQTLDKEVI